MFLPYYDEVLRNVAANFIPKNDSFRLASGRPYEAIASLLNLITPDSIEMMGLDVGTEVPVLQMAYYLLTEYRKIDPEYFPVHDISLLIANIFSLRHTHANFPLLALLDWRLLPAALILAGRGYRVALPVYAENQAAVDALRLKFPLHEWTNLPDVLPGDSVVIGVNPITSLEARPDLLDWLKPVHYGLFLAGWDFLGVKRYDYVRRQWLEKGRLSMAIQLPRPRRQTMDIFPAIIGFGHKRPEEIKLVRVAEIGAGAGSLNQDKILRLLVGPARQGSVVCLDRDEPAKDPVCNLTPAVWLHKKTIKPVQSRLRMLDCAQIIRCQLSRKKLDDDLRGKEITYGEQNDGSWIVREVTMADLDTVSGFLLPDRGTDVRLEFKRQRSEEKYLLQKGDIIFPFRGTTGIGRAGFVYETPALPTIPGLSFVVLRPLPAMESAWLYWFLQSPQVREEVLSKSVGGALLTINIEEIKQISVIPPENNQLALIMENHNAIEREMIALATSRKNMSAKVKELLAIEKNIQESNRGKN